VAVTFTVASGGGSVSDGDRISGSDGVASAGGWILGPNPGTNTLRASAAGLSQTVTFTATGVSNGGAVPSQLVFLVQPSEVKEDAVMRPAVKVALADAAGRVVPLTGVTVSLELTGDKATLKGTTSVKTGDGIAVFSELSLDKIDEHGTFRLRATSRGLPAVESASFEGHD
jgi:hypothetical protein